MTRYFRRACFKLQRNLIAALSFLLALALPIGCGGGLSGTGDIQPTQIAGRINQVDGAAFEGALVTVVETGDSAVSDPTGAFLIETKLPVGPLTLSVQAGTVDGTVSLGEFNGSVLTFVVELEIDSTQKTVKIISQDVIPVPSPTRGSNASSSSSSSKPSDLPDGVSPTPTAAPTQSVPLPDGSNTPPPQPPSSAPTATPTIAPTATPQLQGSTYRGVLKSVKFGVDTPISGATVKVVETGDSFVTDSQGRFRIETDSLGGNITIEVLHMGSSDTDTIPNVPVRDVLVFFEIILTHLSGGFPAPINIQIQAVDIQDGSIIDPL